MASSKDISVFKGTLRNAQFEQHDESTFPKACTNIF